MARGIDLSTYKIKINSPTVKGVIYDIKYTGSEVNDKTICAYYYRYTTKDGRDYTGIYHKTENFKNMNDSVIVKYSKKSPEISVIKGTIVNFPIEILLIPMVFIILGLLITFNGFFKKIKILRIIRYGEIAYGKVIDSVLVSDSNAIYELEFKAKDGKTYKTSIKASDGCISADSEAKLLYLPNDPSKILLFEDLPYLVELHYKENPNFFK